MYLIPIYWFLVLAPIVVYALAYFVVRRRGKSQPEAIQSGCFWFFFGLLLAVMSLQLFPRNWLAP